MLSAGVELGGTKCVAILSEGPTRIEAQARVPTTDPATTLAALREVLDGWRSRFEAIGIASFGPLEVDPGTPGYGRLLGTPKPGWGSADIGAAFAGFGVPVRIDTDVNGAALAEGRWGAAQGLSSWAYITVGTGVGVGGIVDGRPVAGLGHCEAGHMRVPRLAGDAWPGVCPFHGDCVEGLASGTAIAARAGVQPETLPPDSPAWHPVVHALIGLCHNLVLTAVPERIVVGGGVLASRPELTARIAAGLIASLADYGAARRISQGEDYLRAPGLGPLAGPLGAIAIAVSG